MLEEHKKLCEPGVKQIYFKENVMIVSGDKIVASVQKSIAFLLLSTLLISIFRKTIYFCASVNKVIFSKVILNACISQAFLSVADLGFF